MISLRGLSIKVENFIDNTKRLISKSQQNLNPFLSRPLSILFKIYGFTVLLVSKSCDSLSFLLRSITTAIFFIASKMSALSHYLYRKLHVWKILSVRKRWYLSKEGSFYNPKIKATIYPTWECTWNISRLNDNYKGFESRKIAQEVAFKMWMKKRRLKTRLNVQEIKIKVPINLGGKILPNKIYIRKASPKDAIQLLMLMEQLGYPQGDENMKARIQAYSYGTNNHIVVAERGKKIVGFIAFVIYDLFACEGKRCHIEELVAGTNPSDLSIKRKLMEAIEAFARENKGKIINLTNDTYFTKDGNQDFYKFLGYVNDSSLANMDLKKRL